MQTANPAAAGIRKFLADPLLHFIVAGALLFGGFSWLRSDAPTAQAQEPVRIGEGEIRWARETFAAQWRRNPTPEEMTGLLATLINEELLAREARALGLDQQDTVVRRRLAQKLSFLIENTASVADPDEIQLRRYYEDHAEHYRSASRISFRHVFYSPERRPHAALDASRALAQLASASGDERLAGGDPLPLDESYSDLDLQGVSSLFGPDFAQAAFALPIGVWSGPVRSAYGTHLVRVSDRALGQRHRYEDIRDAILADWRRERERDVKERYLIQLRDKYGVVMDEIAQPGTDPAPGREAAP
ncbi:peptidyl-prolyl cis-trans isomerase [Methylobacterium sp. P31]